MTHPRRIALIGDTRRQSSGDPKLLLGLREQQHATIRRDPPADVILPTSNAMPTFLPETVGNDGKTAAGSIMAAGQLLSSVSDGVSNQFFAR